MYIINLTFLTQKVRPFNGGMGVKGGQRKEETREREREREKEAPFSVVVVVGRWGILRMLSQPVSQSVARRHI